VISSSPNAISETVDATAYRLALREHAMNKYAHKIANSTNLFIGGEWVDASSDTLNGVISLLAEDYSSRSSSSDEHMVLDFVARKSNHDRPEVSLRLLKGLGRDNSLDRGERLPVIPMRRGMVGPDPERNSKRIQTDLSRATGDAGERDPIAVYRTEVLCRLLEPIHPVAWGGCRVLWPLWADEMVHRTYVTIHLTALLMSRLRLEHDAPMRFALDYRVASNLAAAIGELVIVHDNERLPCSAVLRGIARNLVELFGPVAGNIGITTRIEPLQLAAFKRRALALLAVELISEALVNAFEGRDDEPIEVQLTQISRSRARLTVMSSGSNQAASVPQTCQPIGRDLASLLEAEIVYESPECDGTAAQIDFLI
jgi:two-component sensor histidine kinase